MCVIIIDALALFLVQQAVRALQNTVASEMAQIETMLINGEASESSVSHFLKVVCVGRRL